MSPPSSLRELSIALAEREIGKPYIWGGSSPVSGFDCSGLVIEVLKATGRLPREGDWTAAALATRFPAVAAPAWRPGDLVFWNRGTNIGHVEMIYAIYGDLVLTIGASGGGSGTTSREAAIAQDAYVKVRPLTPGWVAVVSPFGGLP